MAHPPERVHTALAPALRRRRLLYRPRRLWFADQGGLGAILWRGRHRSRLGLSADAVDRGYGRQSGSRHGGRTAADRAATTPDGLGRLGGGTATALGGFRVGVRRTGRQLWGATGLFGPRRCPALPAQLVHTGMAVHHAATHRRPCADDARDLAHYDLPAAARSWRTRRAQQQAGTNDWDVKFTYNFWRPVTAIRNGDRDDNDATERDPSWTPLNATPMHPEYPSQAAIISGVAVGVLASVFGPQPAIPCTATDVSAPNLQREYTSIAEMADEHKNVRVWGGIHFRNSLEVGEEMGRKIAAYLIANALMPVR